MPYKLSKTDTGQYFVIDDTGKKYSDKPMPKFRAAKQMRALYANEKKATKEFFLDEASTTLRGEIAVFKQADDTWRWIAYSSNAFLDGDREIVSEKALQEDCDLADKTKVYGPLRWWHVGGADLGDCDFNAMHGRILIESGTFRYPAIAERVKEQAPNLQISIGFNHPLTEPDRDGVFHHIKRFERSLLPRGRASNPLTALPIVNKGGNQMLQEKLKALGALLGGNDELVNLVLAQAEKTEKEALAAGTTFKENEKPVEAPPTSETPVEKEDKAPPAAEKPAEPENAMGDMTPEAFTGMLATMLQKAMAPLAADVAMLKEAQSKKDDTEASIKTAVESQAKNIKAIGDKVKELEGEQPRAVQSGYRASQDPGTVVKETSTVKGMKPEIDPTFVAFLKSG